MLPVVEFPQMVRDYAPYFQELFNSRQFKHFREYLTGLITCENITITGMNERFLDRNDQSALNKFLTTAKWDEVELNKLRLELLQQFHETRWSEKGVICIDDVIVHKTGVHIYGVSKLYDHSEGKFVNGQQLVTTHYVDRKTQYPIEYRQYHRKDTPEAMEKGFRTKIELAMELVDDAEARGIPAEVYLADNWFLCKDLTSKIKSYKKHWIFAVKSNRIINVENRNISISDYAKQLPPEAYKIIEIEDKKYRVFSKVVKLSEIGKVRIVISYDLEKPEADPFFLATDCLTWEAKKILNTYGMRWGVETFYRDSKQHLGLEDCQLRNERGIKRHWYLVFLAYTLLRLDVARSRFSRWVSSDFRTIGAKCRDACKGLVQSLVMWCIKMLSSGTKKGKEIEQRKIHQLLNVLLT